MNKNKTGFDPASIEQNLHVPVYTKRGLTLVRGKGIHLWDDQGNRYLDCMSSHGASNLGHTHPKILEAIENQARKLIACPNAFSNDQRATALLKLKAISGLQQFFFCNSGSEAMEAALKFARMITDRRHILSMINAFHGRTLSALATTWNPKYRHPFEPLSPPVQHFPLNDIAAVDRMIDSNTAAVIVEVIQGEGGIRLADHSFLHAIQECCRDRGALFIVDEVQTGFGRTGYFFAYQSSALSPDLVVMAKSMANGIPMGAVGCKGRYEQIKPGIHGSTFGGNPLACAACSTVIDVIEQEALLEKVAATSAVAFDFLRKSLKNVRIVKEIRGQGYMFGIELRQRVTPILKELTTRNQLLALPAGPTVLRLLPALIMDQRTLCKALTEVVETLKQFD